MSTAYFALENVPITPLKDLGADKIIAVNLTDIRGFKKPENILDVLVNALDIAIGNIAQNSLKDADIIIAPDLSEYNPLDTSKKEELIEIGYKETIKALKKI